MVLQEEHLGPHIAASHPSLSLEEEEKEKCPACSSSERHPAGHGSGGKGWQAADR